jgi:hypothetical protein
MVDFASSIGLDHAGLQVIYQHTLNTAIKQAPTLPSYIIKDEAKELWIHHFTTHSHYTPFKLASATLIDQEADHLSQDINETCHAVFEKCKPHSLRVVAWWDNECGKAATAVQEAPTPEL